ncbi:MAG: SAM-dependent chlorinase/fluorinase [Bacillota bacterium]
MNKAGTVVFLTDFGLGVYAGVMKGVVLSLCPEARVVDLTHNVTPQNIREGAWLLLTNYEYFPNGSVFVAVVDPGVGTERKALAVETRNYYFVGPDNGLLYPAVKKAGVVNIVELEVPPAASPTFHGRDVFAPAAARLAAGTPLSLLGRPGSPSVALDFHLTGREGEVITIDRFGNVVTNLPPLGGRQSYRVNIARRTEAYFNSEVPFFRTYGEAPADTLCLVTGSAGTLELSVKNKSAAALLRAQVGDVVSAT